MSIEGVDYSWSRPSPAGLYDAGKRFACRYLSYTESKNLTAAERDRLWSAGLAIVLNWEAMAGAVLDGEARGLEHGRAALAQARQLGAPDHVPIYFSADVNLSLSQIHGPVRAYYAACAEVLGAARVGLYGEYDLIQAALSWPEVDWYWQAAATAWSPAGVLHPRAHIQQYRNGVTVAGGEVDLDRATTTNYGQWEEAMPLTATDLEAISDKLAGDEEFLAAICKTVWKRDGLVGSVPGGPGWPDNATVKGETLTQLAAGGVLALTPKVDAIGAKIDALPDHPVVVDAALLRAVLLDPVVLDAIGKAVAGEISGLDFEVKTS